MKIAYIATGAANMFCGSCMRDNTLAAAMKAQGEDVILIPMYTPLRVDEKNVSEKHIFFGGIEAYLLQKFPNPSIIRTMLTRLAGNQWLLKLMPHFDIGSATDPVQNIDLTLSMLQGSNGNQASLLKEIVKWLGDDLQPNLIHITNSLISGLIPTLKKQLNTPLICGLHGEDIFLMGLPEPYQTQARQLIKKNCAAIDCFIAISHYYAEFYSQWIGLDPQKIKVVRPGMMIKDYPQAVPPRPENRPLTIGYFARIDPAKGLHILADAFVKLCHSGEFPNLQLKVGGYLSRSYAPYLSKVRHILQQGQVENQTEILGTLDRAEKLAFLQSVDVLSVPTVYREPKALFMLESLGNGTPVVMPNHGAFPELMTATQGGLLHTPQDPADLAHKLATVLRNTNLQQKLAHQGHNAIHTTFSAERMAKETLEIYKHISTT